MPVQPRLDLIRDRVRVRNRVRDRVRGRVGVRVGSRARVRITCKNVRIRFVFRLGMDCRSMIYTSLNTQAWAAATGPLYFPTITSIAAFFAEDRKLP